MRWAMGKGEPCLAALGSREQLEGWHRRGRWRRAASTCLGGHPAVSSPQAARRGTARPMATGNQPGMEAAGGPAACYRELSQFPAITRAALGAAAGGQTFLLYTECSRPDLPRRRLLRFSRHYSVRRTDGGGLAASRTALSAGIHNQLLSQDSPTGQHRAVLSRCPRQGHELLEVWDSGGRSHSVDLTALGKHGEVYTEGPFACLAWSQSETRLLYVAEKSRPKHRPPCPWDVPRAARSAEEDEDEEGEQFLYHEDWGEALSTRSVPILCVLDLESSSLSVLEGIPEHLSPGQALWSPGDRGVVFVGWWHEPFRLGLSACSNRRSEIFHLDLSSGCCELLSAENGAACSPRLSPDSQRLLYLEGAVGGPHRQCLRLCMLTWQTRQTVTVLDVVQEPTEGEHSTVGRAGCCQGAETLPSQMPTTPSSLAQHSAPPVAFAGLYTEVLPPRCWAADSRRAVLSTPQRSRTDLLLVDTEAATVTNLTAGSPEGCWELLTLQWDLLVATCSAPHHPPSLVSRAVAPCGTVGYGTVMCSQAQRGVAHMAGVPWHGQAQSHMAQPDPAQHSLVMAQPCAATALVPPAACAQVVAVLPPAGRELPLRWVPVEDTPTVPGVTWKTLTVRPSCSGQSPAAHDTQDFEALLLSPLDGTAPHPLIVCPHGGPHAIFDARWRPSMAALCRLGFAVLLVNYRGSLGFGQASISSLLSRVGEQDVADTQLAVEQALHSEPLDPHRLALLAGSHGAFIALHLLIREPERYQACALRGPVSNLPALLGTSDIPDWRYTSLGLPYSFERVPCAEEVATMLLRSPIAQAAQVRTPVLLCVGARDRRVSPTQALELYRLLRARGVPARLLWYPEGGHALTGVETEADVFKNCARWLLQHLGQPRQDRTGQHSP
ncbi:acylamino-acid-releasing enzyme-like isoform X1 [Pseudopipra pipra]|uniref:acylamino-acid-releasing enzyme-like isoform X1 n=1 Tax=Pseudopipra pipra TaxID=415032 RepID=UPI003138DB45